MRRAAAGALVLAACAAGPDEPAGWPVVYEQHFAEPRCVDAFATSDASSWRWSDAGGTPSLELTGPGAYRPPFRSPRSLALVPDLEVADFDLEVDLLQTGRDYGHRDLCVFFGFESPTRFYYVHLAPAPDAHAHNVFAVKDAPRAALAPVAAQGVDWGRDAWHRVRVERRVGPGPVRVFWDGGDEPILTAIDTAFRWGRLGFGSFDDSGRIARVFVRAPSVRPLSGPADPFRR